MSVFNILCADFVDKLKHRLKGYTIYPLIVDYNIGELMVRYPKNIKLLDYFMDNNTAGDAAIYIKIPDNNPRIIILQTTIDGIINIYYHIANGLRYCESQLETPNAKSKRPRYRSIKYLFSKYGDKYGYEMSKNGYRMYNTMPIRRLIKVVTRHHGFKPRDRYHYYIDTISPASSESIEYSADIAAAVIKKSLDFKISKYKRNYELCIDDDRVFIDSIYGWRETYKK